MPEAAFDEDAWRDRLETYRREKAVLLLERPDSPLGTATEEIEALEWYPLDPRFRVVSRFQPVHAVEEVSLSRTKGPDRTYERVATFGFTLSSGNHVLTGYRATGQETTFVPFTDETTGDDTPATGRYLDVDTGEADAGDEVVLEFNLAQLPFAAYSDRFASTLPPEENHVGVEIQAGEKRPR